jgi:hypothetical protein
VAADVAAFAEEHDAAIAVETIALTEAQVDELALIRAPMPRAKRERYPWWPHAWTVELEALSPDDLAAIVSGAIEDRTDAYVRQDVIGQEDDERHGLIDRLAWSTEDDA